MTKIKLMFAGGNDFIFINWLFDQANLWNTLDSYLVQRDNVFCNL